MCLKKYNFSQLNKIGAAPLYIKRQKPSVPGTKVERNFEQSLLKKVHVKHGFHKLVPRAAALLQVTSRGHQSS